jgi:PilZ domain
MTTGPERRRNTRVELMGQLQGQLVSMDLPIAVLEISLGGMRITTPIAFDVGARGRFMLTLGDGAGVLVLGQIVHCQPIEGATPQAFVSGVQFLDDDDAPDAGAGLSDLVQRIK